MQFFIYMLQKADLKKLYDHKGEEMYKFKFNGFVLFMVMVLLIPSIGNAQESDDLFLDTQEGADMDLLNDPTVKRARTVKVNFDILPKGDF